MSTVIDELVVELNARTERLEQGLAKARAEIGKTVPSANAAGDAGAKMGAKFGDAATGLAAAAENMTRLGTTGGASMSQLVSQSTQLASAFGPGGMIVGGTAIVTLAVLGIGAAATKMAEEVDANLRKIEARVPQTAGRMGELRDMIRDMSLQGAGHSQAELSGAAAEIARQGVGSLEEIQQRLNAVVKVADATGGDMTAIVAGLDQAMDLFGLHANDTEGFLAKLYATAQNRMPITDLFDALQSSAPTIAEFNLDVDTATRALGALLETGKTAKQAGAALKAYGELGAEGRREIEKLAATYTMTGDAIGKLNAAQAKMNDSAEASAAKIRSSFSAAMIDLGNNLLPIVTAELRGLVGLMDHFNGQLAKIRGSSEIASIVTGFSTTGKGVSAEELKPQIVRASERARGGQLDLGGLSVVELDRMAANIAAVAKQTHTAEAYFGDLTRAIAKARGEASKLATATAGNPVGGGKPAPTGASGGVLSPEQVKARQDAEKVRFAKLQDLANSLAKKDLETAAEFEKRVAEAGTKFWQLFGDEMANATDSVVTTTEKTFTAMRALASSGAIILPAKFYELEASAIAASKAMLAAELALDKLSQAEARGNDGTATNLQELESAAEGLMAQRALVAEGSKRWKELGEEIKKVEEKITKIVHGAADANSGLESSVARTTDELINQARAWQQAVDGALQLAEAFGIVDKNIANSLRSVAQLASNLPALSSAWDKRNGTGKGEGMGALVGAALPVAGAVASLVTGFISSAKAAREHAEALRASRAKLSESLRDRTAAMGANDTERRFADIDKQRKDDVAAMLDLLIQQKGVSVGTRSDFLAKDQTGQRAVLTNALATADHAGVREALRAAIEQFDLLAASAVKAKEQLEQELTAKRKDIDESLAERRLRIAGHTEEADALSFVTQQEQDLAKARAEGVYTTAQLAELEAIQNEERAKYLADAQKRRDEEDAKKAQDVARTKEDLQSRINAADGETPAERALRVSIEHRRELEDAMASGADAATLALISMAQAADDVAAAAQAAADALSQSFEVFNTDALGQAQQITDFVSTSNDKIAAALAGIDLSTAEGRKAAETALQDLYKSDSSQGGDIVKVLRAIRNVPGSAADATGAAGDAAAAAARATDAGGATSASGTGIGTATIVQVDRMLGLLGLLSPILSVNEASRAELEKHTALLMRGSGWSIQPPAIPAEYQPSAGASMAGATVIQLGGVRINVDVIAPDGTNARAFGQTIADTVMADVRGGISAAVLDAIDIGLATRSNLSAQGRGDVSR